MALKKTVTENTTNAAADADVATVGAAATSAPAETSAPADAEATAKVAATTAVAKASAGAVAVNNEAIARAKQFKREVEAMQDAADFSYGSHRVFKASNGTIMEMKEPKLDLGRWAKVQLLAWGRHYEVSPGSEDKSSAPYVAYSRDGVTIDSVVDSDLSGEWAGQPVDAYLKFLREEEKYEKATKREFLDTQVAVLGSENEPEFFEIVQITLSSSSIPAFKAYQSQLEGKAKAAAMGLPGYSVPENPFQLYFIREVAAKNGNNWTKLRISSTLPAKL